MCRERSAVSWRHWVRKTIPHTDWEWRQAWIINRYSGRKVVNRGDFVSALMQEEVGERELLDKLMKKPPRIGLHVVEGVSWTTQEWSGTNDQYMGFFCRPSNGNWNLVKIHGPITIIRAVELNCEIEKTECGMFLGMPWVRLELWDREWKRLKLELINRYCGRKAKNRGDLHFTPMMEKLWGGPLIERLKILRNVDQKQYLGYFFIGPNNNWNGNTIHGPITIIWTQLHRTCNIYHNDERQLTKRQPRLPPWDELPEYQGREVVEEYLRTKGTRDCDCHLLGFTIYLEVGLQCLIGMTQVRDFMIRQDMGSFSKFRDGTWKGMRAHELITVVKTEEMSFGSEEVIGWEELGYCSHREIGMGSKGWELMIQMKNCGVRPDGSEYNVLIKGLCKAKRVEDAKKLFEQMIKRNVWLLLYYGTEACKEVLSFLSHDIESTITLECLCIRASLLLKRRWKNDVCMAIKDCHQARKIEPSSALICVTESLTMLNKHKQAVELAIAPQLLAPSDFEAIEKVENIKKTIPAAEIEADLQRDEESKSEYQIGRQLCRSVIYNSETDKALPDDLKIEESDYDALELDFETSLSASGGEIGAECIENQALPEEEEKELKETLQDILGQGKTVKIEQKIDPSILGGIVVEFQQKVFDMSIKTRALQMERFLRQPINLDAQ